MELNAFQEKVLLEQTQAIARTKKELKITVAVAVILAAYLGFIVMKVVSFSHEDVALMMRQNVVQSLPHLRDKLIGSSAEVASKLGDWALSLPRQIHEELHAKTVVSLLSVTRAAEDALNSSINANFDAVMQHLDETMPNADSKEKLEAFLKTSQKDFHQQADHLLDLAYDSYSNQITQLSKKLDLWKKTNLLSDADKIYKEMIQVWLVMAERLGVIEPAAKS